MKQILTILLALVAGLLYAVPATALQYDRAGVDAGQLWRLLTCQWTHWSLDHLLWDVVVFTVLGVICERRDRWSLIATVVLAALAVPLAVHAACPQILTFRGLSGVACSLFGLLLGSVFLGSSKPRWRWMCGVFAAAFVAKCVYEHLVGLPVFVEAGADFVVVPLSHAVGFICGVGVACARRESHVSREDEVEPGRTRTRAGATDFPADSRR